MNKFNRIKELIYKIKGIEAYSFSEESILELERIVDEQSVEKKNDDLVTEYTTNINSPLYGLDNYMDTTKDSVLYYLESIYVSDKDDARGLDDYQKYGISYKGTWSMDAFYLVYTYGLFNHYAKVNCRDLDRHLITYKNTEYSMQELLDEILNSLRILIGEDDMIAYVGEYFNTFRIETFEKIGVILPRLWW